jgi:two-component system chemotaxis sensor kinase CheA
MSSQDNEMLALFFEDAFQMMSETEQCFLDLETNPENPDLIDKIFRVAHSLKGGGNAVGFTSLGAFTHAFESFLLKIKNKEVSICKDVVDLLLKCNDHIKTWVVQLKDGQHADVDSTSLLQEMASLSGGESPGHLTVAENSNSFESPAKDGPISQNTESEHAPSSPQLASVQAPVPQKTSAPTEENIRVSLARLDKLLNRVGELVILHSVLKEQSMADGTSHALKKSILQLGKATREVQDISMGLRMLPIKQVFSKMQRIVRDTSASLGKKINLHIVGESTEVDKTILEHIGDPLVHLIRNACDHGVESPLDRFDVGKSTDGNIHLRAFHQSGSLIIEIQDDGAGLDAEKLQKRAREKGLLAAGATLSDKEAYQLIFAPGFSTKTEVTDLSGRGVGMDVVKTNIGALQGTIDIETQKGSGTCFRIQLPLTLAVIDGMIVKTKSGRFIVPLNHVYETIRPEPTDVHQVTGMGDVLALRGENLPLYHLDNLLLKNPRNLQSERSATIVVRRQQNNFAVMVDEIVGQAQVVIKQLGVEHRHIKGFAGSAILGDGSPALILELEALSLQGKPSNNASGNLRRAQ